MVMHVVYFLAAVVALKAVSILIHDALARRRPKGSFHGKPGPVVDHPIVDITMGRTIGAWIVALPVDVFGGRFVHGMTQYPFFYGQIPSYLFFTAIILAATFTALRWSRRLYRFGRSFVHLKPGSGSVGDRLTGTLTIPRRLPPGTAVQLQLTCIRTSSSYTTGIGGSFHSRTEFDKEQDIDLKTGLDPIGSIPFEFEIPSDATPTTPMHNIGFFNVGYAWSLIATSITPGVDYWAKFAVPIASPGVSQPAFQQ